MVLGICTIGKAGPGMSVSFLLCDGQSLNSNVGECSQSDWYSAILGILCTKYHISILSCWRHWDKHKVFGNIRKWGVLQVLVAEKSWFLWVTKADFFGLVILLKSPKNDFRTSAWIGDRSWLPTTSAHSRERMGHWKILKVTWELDSYDSQSWKCLDFLWWSKPTSQMSLLLYSDSQIWLLLYWLKSTSSGRRGWM